MSNNWTNIGSYIQEYTKGITPKYVQQSNTIVLNQKCIRDNQIDYSFAQFVDDNQNVREDKYIRIGDILINSTGQGTAGRIAFVESLPNDKKVTIDSHILILRCEDIITANLIRYSLFSFEKTLMTFIDGSSGQGEFDKIRLFGTKIKLPTNNNILIVKLLSSIDKKIKLNNKIISELEQMAKELYDYWFVQFDFPDVNGTPYRSSGGKLTYNPILKREIPNDWEVKYLESIAEIVGGATPSTENQEYFTNSGICWITPKDLSNTNGAKYIFKGEKDLTELGIRSASLNVMPIGTVLMSSRAPVGYLSISAIETTTNQGLKSFIPNKGWSTVYLYHTIKHIMPIIEARATGSTFKEIAASDLRGIYWYIPPKELTNIFSEEISSSEIKIRNSLIQNEELSQLRNWLLPMLMNGQVSVQTVSKEETKKTIPIINLSQQQNQRFELWLSNQVAAARGEIDKATLREIFDAMDEDDK